MMLERPNNSMVAQVIKADRGANGGGRMSCLLLKSFRLACDESRFWRAVHTAVAIVLNCSPGSTSSGGRLGAGLRLPHPYNIVISSHSRVGEGCTIFHNVTLGSSEKPPIESSGRPRRWGLRRYGRDPHRGHHRWGRCADRRRSRGHEGHPDGRDGRRWEPDH